jgi:hypothetical protein
MIISAQLFEAYLECATKCWLRSRAEPSAGNAYAEWVHLEDHIYYENGLKRLLASYPEGQREVAPPFLSKTKTPHGALQSIYACKGTVWNRVCKL